MSVQLQFFPTTTTITTSGYQQKLGKCKAGEGQQEHSGTAAKTPSKQNQQIIYSGQISTPFSSPISPSITFAQSPKSVPSITVPAGGLKRIRPPEMDLPEMPNEDDDDYSAAGSTASCVNEPKAKQRRYEERMSSQLGGIYISPEKESIREQVVGQEKQQSRPKIEEIADWDEEFLDDEDELIRQAPLVEEPQTTPTKMDELPGTTNWTKPSEGNQQEGGEDSPKIVELNEEDADIDDEGFIENGDEKDWLGEPGKIVLSEQLRQLIRQDRAQSSTSTNGHHSPLLTRSQIRTGKELIPYIPSPLARQHSISTVQPIEEEKEANEEEVRNDEFLPDVGQIGDEQEGEEEMMEID